MHIAFIQARCQRFGESTCYRCSIETITHLADGMGGDREMLLLSKGWLSVGGV